MLLCQCSILKKVAWWHTFLSWCKWNALILIMHINIRLILAKQYFGSSYLKIIVVAVPACVLYLHHTTIRSLLKCKVKILCMLPIHTRDYLNTRWLNVLFILPHDYPMTKPIIEYGNSPLAATICKIFTVRGRDRRTHLCCNSLGEHHLQPHITVARHDRLWLRG